MQCKINILSTTYNGYHLVAETVTYQAERHSGTTMSKQRLWNPVHNHINKQTRQESCLLHFHDKNISKLV